MSDKTRHYVGANLDQDLFAWLEETRKYERRGKSRMVEILLEEARAGRIARAKDVPMDTSPGAVNYLTLEQAKAQGIING